MKYAGKILIYVVESNNKSKINFRDWTYVISIVYLCYIHISSYIHPSSIIILQFDGLDISSFAQGFALSGFPSRIGFWFQEAAVLEAFGELDIPEMIDSEVTGCVCSLSIGRTNHRNYCYLFVGVMGEAVLRLRSFCPNAGQWLLKTRGAHVIHAVKLWQSNNSPITIFVFRSLWKYSTFSNQPPKWRSCL